MAIRLVRSELAAGRMGLGLAALGRPAYINLGHRDDLRGRTDVGALREWTWAVLDAAYDAGVRYFDAARSYGEAEAFLASWLERRGVGPDDVTVGSKWGYRYTGGWRVDAETHEVKDLSAGHLGHQWPQSNDRLGRWLRLYQIHSATPDALGDRSVLDALGRLRAGGVAIGLTVSGASQGETIERALEVGGFDAVQATWNLLERSASTALAAAHEAGLTVIVKEPVANGRLTSRGDVPLVVQVARDLGVAPDALSLAAVLAQPWADVVLSGASTPEMLRSNLGAARVQVGPEVLGRLEGVREEAESYWAHRSELSWN